MNCILLDDEGIVKNIYDILMQVFIREEMVEVLREDYHMLQNFTHHDLNLNAYLARTALRTIFKNLISYMLDPKIFETYIRSAQNLNFNQIVFFDMNDNDEIFKYTLEGIDYDAVFNAVENITLRFITAAETMYGDAFKLELFSALHILKPQIYSLQLQHREFRIEIMQSYRIAIMLR